MTINYYEKYLKYKQKYVNLSLSMKGGMPSINETELTNWNLITKSGGGDIYRIYYKDIIYTYKKINPVILEDTIKNLQTLDDHFRRMSEYPNLIVPLYLVKDGETIVGYLMRFLSDYKNLDSIINELDINRFMIILNNICDVFLNMYACDVVPCPEHANNIMVNDENDVVFIDLDDILKCAANNQKDTLAQLNLIFMNLPNKIVTNANFRRIFDIYGGDPRLKLEFDTVAGLKKRIIEIAAGMGLLLL